MRTVIATGIAAMFFATAAVPAHAMDPILPFQDVKGGMTGTAYTVVDSSGEIRSFDVDIVGNMDMQGIVPHAHGTRARPRD